MKESRLKLLLTENDAVFECDSHAASRLGKAVVVKIVKHTLMCLSC